MKRAIVSVAVIIIILLAPTSAPAQATGQINGTVTDATGGVLPGVTVEATNTTAAAACRGPRRRSSPIAVRIEGFNIWNHARFGPPNGTIGSATFGQITTSDDGRVIQLGIKYIF